MLAYVLLAIIDLINCTIPGQEISIWLRPIQMIVLLFWVNQLKLNVKRAIVISFSLLIAAVLDYLFYKYGAAIESKLILLQLAKVSQLAQAYRLKESIFVFSPKMRFGWNCCFFYF